jgi:hypothetical protein
MVRQCWNLTNDSFEWQRDCRYGPGNCCRDVASARTARGIVRCCLGHRWWGPAMVSAPSGRRRRGGTKHPEDRGKPCIGGLSEGRHMEVLLPRDLADWIGAWKCPRLVHWCCGWPWHCPRMEAHSGGCAGDERCERVVCLLSLRAIIRALVVAASSPLRMISNSRRQSRGVMSSALAAHSFGRGHSPD